MFRQNWGLVSEPELSSWHVFPKRLVGIFWTYGFHFVVFAKCDSNTAKKIVKGLLVGLGRTRGRNLGTRWLAANV